MSSGVTVRGLGPGDPIAGLTELLRRAYAELGTQGLRFTAVDQSESKARERIAKGRCFVAMLDGANLVLPAKRSNGIVTAYYAWTAPSGGLFSGA